MMPLLQTRSGACSFVRRSTSSDRGYRAWGRTRGYRRSTVSTLWFRISGRSASTASRAAGSPTKSGMSTSTVVPGDCTRISRMVAAKSDAPPSGSSSRFTLVTTACPRAICATAAPTRAGSSRSTTPGRPVFTAQKPHERVQVSPRIMNVAVPAPQHSAMFGQWASSQTVWSDFDRMRRRRFSYSGPIGRRTLSQSGRARSIGTTVFAALRPRERGRSTSPGISNLIGASSPISTPVPRCPWSEASHARR